MKVVVKDFSVEMELKNRGVELQVNDNEGKQLGDLVINKARLEWCAGRTKAGNGVQIPWKDFIEFASNFGSAKSAKTAKKAGRKAATRKKAASGAE